MKKLLLYLFSFCLIFILNFQHTFSYELKSEIKNKIDLRLEKVYTKISNKNLKSQVSIYKKLKIKLNILKIKYKNWKKTELINYIYDNVKKKYSKVFKEYALEKKGNSATKEINFDVCFKIDKYKNEWWYSNFATILSKNNISNKIIDSCLSLDKTIFLIMLERDYCKWDTVYKYNIDSKELSKASLDDSDRWCLASPSKFGKRNGFNLHLVWKWGDSWCSNIMYYDYNYIKNIITLKKECSKCEWDKLFSCEDY